VLIIGQMDFIVNLLSGLGVDKTLPIMMGIFIAGYAVARLLGFGELSDTLIERDERTAGREHRTEAGRQNLAEISTELLSKLKGANAEVAQVFATIRNEAIGKQNEIIKLAREKAQNEVEKSRLEISRTMDAELKKISEQSLEMAALIVQQLSLGRAGARLSARAQREV
jgi:F0F1-type ATP synthase membrane subunit b/b'